MLDTVKSRVNGLDLNALGEVVEAIQADAGKAKVSFDVTTRWTGQTSSETTVDGSTIAGERIARSHKIVADEPCELLDSTAPQSARTANGGGERLHDGRLCRRRRNTRIPLDSLEIRTSGNLDLRGFLGLDDKVPPGYESIRYEVAIKGDGTPEQFEEIHETVMKTSPNFFNLNRPIRMEGTLRRMSRPFRARAVPSALPKPRPGPHEKETRDVKHEKIDDRARVLIVTLNPDGRLEEEFDPHLFEKLNPGQSAEEVADVVFAAACEMYLAENRLW